MFDRQQLVPLECDAPPYAVVRACRLIGLQSPEDVRWCRLGHGRTRPPGRLAIFDLKRWQALLGIGEETARSCSCGRPRPRLERYTFLFESGRNRAYLLGQCTRCRTIYWEEP